MASKRSPTVLDFLLPVKRQKYLPPEVLHFEPAQLCRTTPFVSSLVATSLYLLPILHQCFACVQTEEAVHVSHHGKITRLGTIPSILECMQIYTQPQ